MVLLYGGSSLPSSRTDKIWEIFGKMSLFICLRILMTPSKIFRSMCNEVFARHAYNSLVFI